MNRESSSLSPPIMQKEFRSCGSGSVVEHLLAKEKVAGSIPVSRSNVSGLEATGRVVSFLISKYTRNSHKT